MGCAAGAQSKLLVSTSTTFNASSERYAFIYETIQKQGRIVGPRGITGTRSQPAERTKLGQYKVGGRLAMDTSPLDLDKWLPRILGAAEDDDVFAVAETLPAFYTLINKVSAVFRYDSCYINRAVFRGEADPEGEGSIIEFLLDIMAKDETLGVTWPDPEPALGVAAANAPYILHEGVLTIDSVAYPIRDFVLALDNHMEPRWVNSITATEICPQSRTVILRTTNPFTATEYADLYNNTDARSGVAADLTFTNGDFSTEFALAGLQWADTTPVVKGKFEIPLYLDFAARMKSTDREIVVTNVSVAP